jgi:hypothetical protein
VPQTIGMVAGETAALSSVTAGAPAQALRYAKCCRRSGSTCNPFDDSIVTVV